MPVKSYAQVQAEEAARKALAQTKREARIAELDYFQQIEQQRVEQQAVWNHEHELLARRIEYGREHSREIDRSTMPNLDGIYQQIAAQEQAAEAEAERQRIASITPRQIWKSTLNFADRQRVEAWEGVNKQPYPVPGLD